MGTRDASSSTFAVFDLCAAPVVVFERRGIVLFANRACQRSLGMRDAIAIGRPVWESLDAPEWYALRDAPESLPATIEHSVGLGPAARAVQWNLEADDEGCIVATAVQVSEPAGVDPRALIDSVHDYALLMMDPKGQVTVFSAGARSLVGYSAPEMIGRSYSMLFVSEDVQTRKPEKILEIAARDGRHDEQGWRLRKDGLRFWAHATVTPIRDASGALTGFAQVMKDVTARRRSDEKRDVVLERVSTERRLFEAVLRQLPVGVVVRSASGELLAYNDAVARELGGDVSSRKTSRAPGVMALRADRSPYGDEDTPSARVLAGETIPHEQMIIVYPDGTERIYDVSGQPISGVRGALEASVLIYTDATDRHRVLDQLRARERLLRTVVDALPVGLCIFDGDGRIESMNPAARQIFGTDTFGSLEASRIDGTPIVHDDWPHVRALGGEIVIGELVRVHGSDGRMRVLLHGAVPLRGNDDAIVGAIAVGEDVTALLAAEEQARSAVRARDEMMRVVSHDLRTPLAVVIGQGQQLGTGLSIDELQVSSGRIVRAARRMQRLVEDLLDTSRIDARLLSIEPQLQAIPPVLEDAAELARSLVRDREIRVQTPPVLPSARVDRDRVQQVLANLVENAVRHTRPGGHITLGVRLDGGPEVTWYVEDDGAGIAHDELPHVFDRYWQGTAATRGALGLGLSICKAIVEAHGGRIWAESTPGCGATFAFTTPATPLATAMDPAVPA